MTTLLDTLFVYAMYIATVLASFSLFWWSTKSLVLRRKLFMDEFSDWILVIVGIYWSAYSVWLILMADKAGLSDTSIFNMRFAILLTLAAFASLVKDRLLLAGLFDRVGRMLSEEEEHNELQS